MRIVKSFFIALSMYSRIPVPRFEWRKEDVRYLFCFFPWIGALIGVCVYLWVGLCDAYSIGSLCRTTGAAALSLLITGGFHADGFLDTMDAIHSYQPRERKLEILKDSHIGAFAVILFILLHFLRSGKRKRSELCAAAFFCHAVFAESARFPFPLPKRMECSPSLQAVPEKQWLRVFYAYKALPVSAACFSGLCPQGFV